LQQASPLYREALQHPLHVEMTETREGDELHRCCAGPLGELDEWRDRAPRRHHVRNDDDLAGAIERAGLERGTWTTLAIHLADGNSSADRFTDRASEI